MDTTEVGTMVEDAVGSDRRTGDVFALYAEIYALRLGQDVVSLAPSCPIVPAEGPDPSPRRWRSRR